MIACLKVGYEYAALKKLLATYNQVLDQVALNAGKAAGEAVKA